MFQTSIQQLHAARCSRQRAQEARLLVRADAQRPSKEQLRLYARHLEQAARTIERSAIATRPRDGVSGADCHRAG